MTKLFTAFKATKRNPHAMQRVAYLPCIFMACPICGKIFERALAFGTRCNLTPSLGINPPRFLCLTEDGLLAHRLLYDFFEKGGMITWKQKNRIKR